MSAMNGPMGKDEVLLLLMALQEKWRPLGCVLDAVTALYAERDALKAENTRLRDALNWYAVKVNECRKLGKDGDMARGSLDKDGGSIARAALATEQENKE